MDWIRFLKRISMGSCLNCGSLWVRRSSLCEYCEKNIREASFAGLQVSYEKGLRTYSLFEWNPGESLALSLMLTGLKGAGHREAWGYWAETFLNERRGHLPKMRYVFIPAPSVGSSRQHARLFASALSERTGGRLWDVLRKTKSTHQRGLSRRQRRRLRIECDVNFAYAENEEIIILVDDILTSGATAHSCYLALGSPRHFEVWVLGKRGLSCGV